MKYSITYRKDFKYFDKVDEIIFFVKRGDTDSIINFIPTIVNNDQRVVLDICEYTNKLETILPAILQLKEIHNNIAIRLYKEDIESINILSNSNISFFFIDIPHTLEQLYTINLQGPSDIYITEELAFRMDDISYIKKTTPVNFRIFPDVAQSSKGTSDLIPSIVKFWVRPEDTEVYEDYIDTFEFFRRDSRLSAVFEIYKQRQWRGEVKDYLCDVSNDFTIPNGEIPPHFAYQRLNCRKKCIYGQCDTCFKADSFARMAQKANLTITREKYKEDKE